MFYSDAGWSSSVARRAHNPKVAGSNPAPATKKDQVRGPFWPGLVASVQPRCNPLQPNVEREAAERASTSTIALTVMTRQRPWVAVVPTRAQEWSKPSSPEPERSTMSTGVVRWRAARRGQRQDLDHHQGVIS